MKTYLMMILIFLLMTSSAFAWNRVGHVARYYDKKGDRIAHEYDVRGDLLNEHYDYLALKAALNGNFGHALALDMKGDQLDAMLDAKGESLDRHLDRKGRRIGHAMDRECRRLH